MRDGASAQGVVESEDDIEGQVAMVGAALRDVEDEIAEHGSNAPAAKCWMEACAAVIMRSKPSMSTPWLLPAGATPSFKR